MFEGCDNFYELQVADFMAGARLKGYSICAIVEAEPDVAFWRELFNFSNLNSDFIYASKGLQGEMASGVYQCLQFIDCACRNFVICIDSDYRYLTQEERISVDHYVFQTYTYAIENHYCHYSRLNEVCHKCCGFENLIFDFEQFLRSYSEVLYPLFLWHIYSIKYRLQGFDTSAFLSIINSSYEGVPFCDVANNSSAVLYKLKTLCTATIMELKDSYPNVCLGPVEGELISLGVTPQNVYLFIRGHNLQPLVQAIGKEVIDEILRTEKVKLNNDLEKIRELYVAPGQPHQKSVQY